MCSCPAGGSRCPGLPPPSDSKGCAHPSTDSPASARFGSRDGNLEKGQRSSSCPLHCLCSRLTLLISPFPVSSLALSLPCVLVALARTLGTFQKHPAPVTNKLPSLPLALSLLNALPFSPARRSYPCAPPAPQCGGAAPPDANFCPGCGAARRP